MSSVIVDDLVIFFSLVHYTQLVVVFLLRPLARAAFESKMNPVFSILLIPLVSFGALRMRLGIDAGRLIAGFPMILYLGYDLWFREIARRKPYHHPQK
ncbi:MAG TPA: hypothetical protein VFF30_08030 [Nitrososphaerales archaeon]|nr:hypothetical protein [Nitrososphaerales archaeon]